MAHNITNNPFICIFQQNYEQLQKHPDFKRIAEFVTDLLTMDEQDIMHAMTNDLGNTITIYSSKQKNPIQSITLKIDGPETEFLIPSIVLASAYDNFVISGESAVPENELLPPIDIPLYKKVTFGNILFSQLGGCDIDYIPDFLYDCASDETVLNSDIFVKAQSLAIIKICELLYNACNLLMQGERFRKLTISKPFAFLATLDDKEFISLIHFT
ncbi:TPA: hypothetical protein ENS27_02445 [bacterium]|nr:hypothetical protein [bacterium]